MEGHESFAEIMAQLDASKGRVTSYAVEPQRATAPVGEWYEPKPAWVDEARPTETTAKMHVQRVQPRRMQPRSRSTVVRKAAHPEPFGPGRGIGGEFSRPGNLFHRDLTPWEQERAIMPERSYPASRTICVVRQWSPMVGSLASTGPVISHSAAARASDQLRCTRGDSAASRWPESPNRTEPGCRPVRNSDSPARSRALGTDIHQPKAVSRDSHPALSVDVPYAFGDGSQLRKPQRKCPQAGGPFAGPRFFTHRDKTVSWDAQRAKAAAESYSYLGPGTDGPQPPPIHPIWS